jgi:hypothetical protein
MPEHWGAVNDENGELLAHLIVSHQRRDESHYYEVRTCCGHDVPSAWGLRSDHKVERCGGCLHLQTVTPWPASTSTAPSAYGQFTGSTTSRPSKSTGSPSEVPPASHRSPTLDRGQPRSLGGRPGFSFGVVLDRRMDAPSCSRRPVSLPILGV